MSHLTRREFLAGVSTLALGCAGRGGDPPPRARSDANVLLILTDQQRWDALGCAGNKILETPNLDRLARQGVRFSQATCAAPLCGPSRASLLSGQYLFAHACPGNAELGRPGMPEEVETWEETLSARGWHTAYHGKWHTGSANTGVYRNGLTHYLRDYHAYLAARYPGREREPGERIDRYSRWPYRPTPLDEMMRRATAEGRVMPHHPEAGRHTVPAGESLTAWTAGQTLEFLAHPPEGPWSATCSILHPHAPLIAPSPYFERYDPAAMPMPRTLDDVFTPAGRAAIPDVLTLTPEGMGRFISLYYGLVGEVDFWVGKLLDALEASGQADRTLVVFTSDHGEMMGDHARVSKMVFYEASLRVPLIMRFPGQIPEGVTMEAPASGADVAPTILDCLGVPVPASMHGRSLLPVAQGRDPEFDLAYAELGENLERPMGQRMARSREWKLAFWRQRAFLYHLLEDPDETRNLLDPAHRAEKWVGEARRLRQAMLDRLEAMGSPERDVIARLEI